MSAAGIAQVIDRLRGGGGQVRLEMPVVEDAQWVGVQPAAGVIGQARLVGAEIVDQRLPKAGATGGVPDGVQAGDDAREPALAVEARGELQELGVDHRSGVADDLAIPLAELPVATRLRAVVAEHWTQGPQAQRTREDVHPVLEVGTHDGRRRLRAQHPVGALLVTALRAADGEHLLLDDIARLTGTAREQLDSLEQRSLDPLEAMAVGEVARNRLDAAPARRFGWQDVARAAWRGDGAGHG